MEFQVEIEQVKEATLKKANARKAKNPLKLAHVLNYEIRYEKDEFAIARAEELARKKSEEFR